jgi:hypothetical protein
METGQRKIRCPKCGVRFAAQPADIGRKGLPDSEADPNGLSDLAIDLGMSPSAEPQEGSAVIPRINVGDLKIDASDDEIPAQTQPRATLPPEPWFYGFLDGWGMFYMCAAAITFIGLCLAVALWITGNSKSGDGLSPMFLFAVVVVVALFGTFLVTIAAAIFLIVDQARNIRRLQLSAERTEKA